MLNFRSVALMVAAALGLAAAAMAKADGNFDPTEPATLPTDSIDYTAINEAISWAPPGAIGAKVPTEPFASFHRNSRRRLILTAAPTMLSSSKGR